MKGNRGFTLIELLMVVAIISIIATLAVNKVGGVREAAARKVSLANQEAIERGVSAFLSMDGNRLNRLDALVNANGDSPIVATGSGDGFGAAIDNTFTVGEIGHAYMGPKVDDSEDAARAAQRNTGLHPSLLALFCSYSLNQNEVNGLVNHLGLSYLMFHRTDYDNNKSSNNKSSNPTPGADGSYPRVENGNDPEFSACITCAVTNGLKVLAINPKTTAGRAIYRAFGQELMNTVASDGTYDDAAVIAEVVATGGPLIAFGLGAEASVIGSAKAGLDNVPTATFVKSTYYRRYILLFRLRPHGTTKTIVAMPEFAGVLDCIGNTILAAQDVLRSL